MKVITLEKVRAFCKERYYADDGVLWADYALLSDEVLRKQIEIDVYELCLFLGVDYEKEGI